MSEEELPYIHKFRDSRGKTRRVFRRNGHKQVTIKGEPHSVEFQETYQALLERTAPKTIGQSRGCADTTRHTTGTELHFSASTQYASEPCSVPAIWGVAAAPPPQVIHKLSTGAPSS
jgi:hypothetical protein